MSIRIAADELRLEGRSFLKWAGGKTRYAAQLASMAPPYTGRYYEPFMGSAAVFFELRAESASLSDTNPELVVCFQEVAKQPDKVMELLDQMPNNREFYNEIRAKDVSKLSDLERAARMIYLNKTGFRGLWRVNKKGKFNVPYGAYDRPYYNRDTLLAASADLQNAHILHRDYLEALEEAQAGDWIFLDPPYIPVGGYSDFKRYTPEQFHENDHRQLSEAMETAARRGVFVTLTNSNTALTREVFSEFNVVAIATRRDINLNSKGRGSTDLVFTSYEIPVSDDKANKPAETPTLFDLP